MLPPELAGPIDDLMQADLQLWRDGCFAWLLISTAVVGIGILFESPEVWHQTIGTFRPPGRNTPSWVTLLASFGWLLIAAGVIGEGLTEAMVSKAVLRSCIPVLAVQTKAALDALPPEVSEEPTITVPSS